jgi:hypothetical protein
VVDLRVKPGELARHTGHRQVQLCKVRDQSFCITVASWTVTASRVLSGSNWASDRDWRLGLLRRGGWNSECRARKSMMKFGARVAGPTNQHQQCSLRILSSIKVERHSDPQKKKTRKMLALALSAELEGFVFLWFHSFFICSE